MSIKDKLIHAVTQYDMRASRRSGYNPYALGQYFERVDQIMADMENGATPRAAIVAGFSGRLADACLRAVGEPITTVRENTSGNWFYQPAGGR